MAPNERDQAQERRARETVEEIPVHTEEMKASVGEVLEEEHPEEAARVREVEQELPPRPGAEPRRESRRRPPPARTGRFVSWFNASWEALDALREGLARARADLGDAFTRVRRSYSRLRE